MKKYMACPGWLIAAGFVVSNLAPLPLTHAAAPALIPLPPAMLGVWAPDIKACTDADMSDSRIAISQEGVDYFASSWQVRVWQKYRDFYRGHAVVHAEGEALPLPGSLLISLHLLSDGKLEVQKYGTDKSYYVKCPAGITIY